MSSQEGIGRRAVLSGVVAGGAGLALGQGVETASADPKRLWAGDIHRKAVRIACDQTGVSPLHRQIAATATLEPDEWNCRCDPRQVAGDVVPNWAPDGVEREVAGLVEQLPHSYEQYYNPGFEVTAWGFTVDVGGFGNAPDNVRKYANRARESSGVERWRQLGYAAHFLTDVGQPLHTGEEFDQATNEWVHHSYERGIEAYWPDLEGAFRGDGGVHEVDDPEAATKDLARITHERSKRVFELIHRNRGWREDPDVRDELLALSRECLAPTGRYLRGLIEWVRNEDTGGETGDDGDDGGSGGWWWWLT
jgi:hypothetical protein